VRLVNFVGGAFSASVTIPVNSVYDFPRHSNAAYEVDTLNAPVMSSAHTPVVGNHCLCWPIDSGASWQLGSDPHLLVNHVKPCNVMISTAKSGESIMATGVGDACLNTWNELGHSVVLTLNSVSFVREARRNLLSVLITVIAQRRLAFLLNSLTIFSPSRPRPRLR
jgi:hypothetical protein